MAARSSSASSSQNCPCPDSAASCGSSGNPRRMRWPTAREMGLEGGQTPPPYHEWDPLEHDWVYNQALADAHAAELAAAGSVPLCSVSGGRKSSKRKSKKRRSVGRRTLLKRRKKRTRRRR